MKQRFAAILAAVILASSLLGSFSPTSAVQKMTTEGINEALIWGMEHGGLGLYDLLGPNWIEGPDGMLLNIYTPFMMLASKAARGGFPTIPNEEDVKEARKRYARDIRNIRAPKGGEPLSVKFSVSLIGADPTFARYYYARIIGYGRGKKFYLTPYKSIKQQFAKAVPNVESNPYEAINAYYFAFDQVQHLDEFDLILQKSKDDPAPITFKVRGDRVL